MKSLSGAVHAAAFASALLLTGPLAAGVITVTDYRGALAVSGLEAAFTDNPTSGFLTESRPGAAFGAGNIFGSSARDADGTITFENGIAGLGRQSSGFSETEIRQTVTNETGAVKDISFRSLILPGSLGIFIPNYFPLFGPPCDIMAIADCTDIEISDNGDQSASGDPFIALLGRAYAALDVTVLFEGIEKFSLSLSIEVGNPDGKVAMALDDGSFLENFRLLSPPGDDDSRTAAWDSTDLVLDLGRLGIGETADIAFLVRTSFETEAPCGGQSLCPAAVSYFGDPIGGGGDLGGGSRVLSFLMATPTIEFLPLQSTPPPGIPVPATVWLFAMGLLIALGRLYRPRTAMIAA